MNFGKGYFKTFKQGIEREWVISNGIGGYAGNSMINSNFRAHHSYLNASLNPPVNRYNILAKTDETLTLGDHVYSLACNEYVGWKDEGYTYLQRFSYENYPTFYYQIDDCFVKKSIALEYGKNTVAICFTIKNGMKEAELSITPFFNYRDHSFCIDKQSINFDYESKDQTILLSPKQNQNLQIKCMTSCGEVRLRDELYKENLVYDFDIKTGSTTVDNHFTPYDFIINIKPHEEKSFYIICTIEKDITKDGFKILEETNTRMKALVNQANIQNDFANRLVKMSDHFISYRESTQLKTILAGLPWFTDWGRDTMIAMQGLTLVTKRFNDAKEILESFSKYIQNGLVPNMFPDTNQEPLYNTVDASMWYFHSVHEYLKYTNDHEFIKNKIYPKLKEIIHAYKTGTLFSIYMDNDYLIHAGSGLDQVTWMDVRINGYVVTPRHGKPVEINALWYNALMVMHELATKYGDKDANHYEELATKVKQSFNDKFYNEETQCLYDVIDEYDASIRPNQIYAVSLPYTMLPKEKEKMVVNKVSEVLYNTYGLRSLSPLDEGYIESYEGKLWDRDMAYHMGTTWGFLIGGYITAYCKVNDYSKESINHAKYMLELFEDHLNDGCIDGIAEIFDGDNPTTSRGCYSQAWSVGEVLRAYVEDVLKNI